MPIIANKKSYIIKKDNKYYDFVNLFKRATLTVSPSPADATVTLTADGYTQSGNSITVIKGTMVSWSVSKTDYLTQSGTITMGENNQTLPVVLDYKWVTFQINPSPADATVTLTADGYTQSGNSITVIKGTTVSWSVSKNTYTTQSGQVVVNSNETKYVELQLTGPLYRCYTGELFKYAYINPNDTTKAYVYSNDANTAASSSSELVEFPNEYSVSSVSENTLVLNITIWSSTDPYTFTRDTSHDLYT